MIIFLDFDGVLHPFFPSKDLTDEENQLFSRTPRLWRILRECPNVQVVFSTSWRVQFPFQYNLECATKGGGEDLVHRFIGSTPNLETEGMYGRRDLEIEKWLNTNKHSGRWLAIDDMAELFADQTNFHLVNGDIGLTDADVLAIIGRLR